VQASAEIEDDCTSSWGSMNDQDEQLTSEQQLLEQHHRQQQQNRQDYAPASGHVAADIADRQASSSGQSPNEHLQQMHQPSRQTRPDEQTAAVQSYHAVVSASTPAKGLRRVFGSSSHDIQLKNLQQQEDGLALVDDASYLIDVLIQRQGLKPQQLDVNVKLGLIVQAVGLLVTHRHQQEDHRCSPCQLLHVHK
jgi:phosphatidate phosphatase PAH1